MPRTRVGCYIVAVNADRVLTAHVAPGYGAANRWTLPGGGVEWGEHPEDALVREVYEESGFRLDSYRFLGSDSREFPERDGHQALHWIRLYFGADLDGEPRVTEEDGSVDDVRWTPIDELPNLDTVDMIEIGLRLAGHSAITD